MIQFTRNSYTLQLNDSQETMIPLSKQSEKELQELLGYWLLVMPDKSVEESLKEVEQTGRGISMMKLSTMLAVDRAVDGHGKSLVAIFARETRKMGW